jgi:N-acetylglucosaminyldiphosphoundecaprenol N-acetyl-beta-D-mannosaminyltransferase
LGAGALIGVGGTIDVLAGVATRTPGWTRRWGLEWAYRVGLDPKRWHRIPRLARFVALTLRHRG